MMGAEGEMPTDPTEVAKRVLIDYRQLEAMLKDHIGIMTAKVNLGNYNRILKSLMDCFVIDESFRESIKHLRSLNNDTDDLSFQMESDGKILLATAHSFIEMYLSPEDKKKAIGF